MYVYSLFLATISNSIGYLKCAIDCTIKADIKILGYRTNIKKIFHNLGCYLIVKYSLEQCSFSNNFIRFRECKEILNCLL